MYNLGWSWGSVALLIIALILIPVFVILFHIPFINQETLAHLSQHVLPRYIIGSLIVLVGVIAITFIIGISTAYLIAFYGFFGSKVFEWALILPLAIPAYIMGFAWVNLLEYEGTIPTLLGIESRIDIMNTYGAIMILAFALYPYVYFFVKGSFSRNLGSILLSAQSLNASSITIFWKVILPFCRLSIVGALSLVGMETLSEYGLVAYFGVDTFSAGIFRTWLAGGDEVSGIALSAVLLCFVLMILGIESYQRGSKGYAQKQFLSTSKKQLYGFKSFMAFLWCFIVLFFAFIIPMLWLLYWGFYDFFETFPKFVDAIYYSVIMSVSSAFFIVVISYYLCFVVRVGNSKIAKIILKISSLGYAIPGAVVAIGILLFLGFINHNILEPLSIQYALGGGFSILFFGYLVRFLASGIFALESGYAKIPKNFDYACLTLRTSPFVLFGKIHFPLLRWSLVLAFIIVCIDVLKELPISTILASSGYQTLAAAAFAYSENEQIYDAALPSVLIVFFGLIPTFLMHYFEQHNHTKELHEA